MTVTSSACARDQAQTLQDIYIAFIDTHANTVCLSVAVQSIIYTHTSSVCACARRRLIPNAEIERPFDERDVTALPLRLAALRRIRRGVPPSGRRRRRRRRRERLGERVTGESVCRRQTREFVQLQIAAERVLRLVGAVAERYTGTQHAARRDGRGRQRRPQRAAQAAVERLRRQHRIAGEAVRLLTRGAAQQGHAGNVTDVRVAAESGAVAGQRRGRAAVGECGVQTASEGPVDAHAAKVAARLLGQFAPRVQRRFQVGTTSGERVRRRGVVFRRLRHVVLRAGRVRVRVLRLQCSLVGRRVALSLFRAELVR